MAETTNAHNEKPSDTPERANLLHQLGMELVTATNTRQPVAPLRDRVSSMSLDDAYQVQEAQLQHWQSQGRILAGRKVGLTSFAMQEQLGVDSPDFGFFFSDMVHDHGDTVAASDFVSPKVEPEIGVVLKHDLKGPGVTLEQAREAVKDAYPAIEIIDSRVADWDIRLVDTVADNASCGAIVVGKEPINLSTTQLPSLRTSLVINGETKETGEGTAVMDDPIAPLAWLANVLGEQGVTLEAGQLVLTGSFTKALPVVAGESATADFGEHGSLTINFG